MQIFGFERQSGSLKAMPTSLLLGCPHISSRPHPDRVLLQRALRLNPVEQTLWREVPVFQLTVLLNLQYFRLELLYLEKVL